MKVIGFAGYSGSGKTTLIEQLIPRFVMRGLRVSLIKHAHHSFDIDQPGKDSFRHREAGASEILLTSAHRWVLMHELRGEPEPGLREQLRLFSPCDLVLVVNTYHHFPGGPRYLRRLRRLLRPGGRLVNVDFEKRETPVGPPLERRIARDAFLRDARRAGLRLVREATFLPYQYCLVLSPR